MTKVRILILLVVAASIFLVIDYQRPNEHTSVHVVEVLALADNPEISGGRIIRVRFSDGTEKQIKTLTPFFYRPGYKTNVGVFKRTIFPDILDFIADQPVL